MTMQDRPMLCAQTMINTIQYDGNDVLQATALGDDMAHGRRSNNTAKAAANRNPDARGGNSSRYA